MTPKEVMQKIKNIKRDRDAGRCTAEDAIDRLLAIMIHMADTSEGKSNG